MIGGLIRLLIRLGALPLYGLVLAWRRFRLSKVTVVDVVLGGGAREHLGRRLERERFVRRIARDPRVRAIRLVVHSVPMGWAATQGLRAALAEVHAAGKPIVARVHEADDRSLYLVGLADAVWMPPGGEVILTGLAGDVPFYGPALSRLGVEVDVESAGAYKSLGEPYTRSYPTTANREALTALLTDLDVQVTQTLAADRDLDPAAIRAAQGEGPFSAEQAAERGLIDQVGYADEMATALEEAIGGEPRHMEFERYVRLTRLADAVGRLGRRRPRVAVVHLQGPVVERRGRTMRSRRLIASDQVVPALDGLIDNDSVKAVVLVVDSPGGSALASDLIARSVTRLDEKKPVVVAMESVAASGGYYIAAPAREIVARPGTVTGSIGVVGGKLVLGPGLARLGVHTEQMGPGKDASMHGPWARFTDDQRRRYRASLARFYDRFISVVAAGRGRETEQIHAVAQGRVWTGVQAQQRGLVDHLGGVEEAVARARALAEMADGPIRRIVVHFDPPRWGALSAMMGGTASASRAVEPADALDLGLSALGPAGWLPAQLRSHPAKALAVVPSVIDERAWATWAAD